MDHMTYWPQLFHSCTLFSSNSKIVANGSLATFLVCVLIRSIVDSGAMDHMTYSPQLFHSCTLSSSNSKIVANGSLATVSRYGDICLSSKLIFKNVLHVQKLSTSLISVRKVTYDLNCFAMFPHLCAFYKSKSRGGGLDLLKKEMDFIIKNQSKNPKLTNPCLCSMYQIKTPLVIPLSHKTSIIFCFKNNIFPFI